MSGSSFGELFKVTTFGESHGPAVGCVIDGCPSGLKIDEESLRNFVRRRRPGQSDLVTSRKESDEIEILSGIFMGETTGTPIAVIIKNEGMDPGSYDDLKNVYRPGHADLTYYMKYGFRDYRGGGRSSGRETAGRVIAGAIASQILSEIGISVCAFTESIGDVCINKLDFSERLSNDLYMPDREAFFKAKDLIKQVRSEKDSIGGVISCLIRGLPGGIGEPVFDKLDAQLSKAVMSIGAVKSVEFGNGFKAALSRGSEFNDQYYMREGSIEKKTNNAGGIYGGISDGSDIIIRAAVKPTPSIGKNQDTVTTDGEDTTISIKGRHDPCIVPRAVSVVEAMVAITVLDLCMRAMSTRLSDIKNFFRNLKE